MPSTSCAQAPCLHAATCTDSPGGSGAGYVCDCDGTGYAGAHCQDELNHCAGSPCGPGDCLPQPGGFLCACGPELQGATCQVKREPEGKTPRGMMGQEAAMDWEEDPCLLPATNPCLPGGACVFAAKEVSCDCFQGFFGPHCQVRQPALQCT
jgi:hypothetical protein